MHHRRPSIVRDRDWRAGPLPSRRLLFAVTRSLAASRDVDGDDGVAALRAVLARAVSHGRTLEVTVVGVGDVVESLAAVAGRFHAELVVRQVPAADDPAVDDALRRGAVVVAGTLAPPLAPDLARAPA
ncbi:MAG TPA: hypothetical protein VFI28_04625 [Candidatus Limnocylindrales bacterium]|nr:hypothetical protein [Candidatus Limnocylindrales bacterium]